jgi:hypothetical protein
MEEAYKLPILNAYVHDFRSQKAIDEKLKYHQHRIRNNNYWSSSYQERRNLEDALLTVDTKIKELDHVNQLLEKTIVEEEADKIMLEQMEIEDKKDLGELKAREKRKESDES